MHRTSHQKFLQFIKSILSEAQFQDTSSVDAAGGGSGSTPIFTRAEYTNSNNNDINTSSPLHLHASIKVGSMLKLEWIFECLQSTAADQYDHHHLDNNKNLMFSLITQPLISIINEQDRRICILEKELRNKSNDLKRLFEVAESAAGPNFNPRKYKRDRDGDEEMM